METFLHIQGSVESTLTPLFLIHAISGLALPYFALGNLSNDAKGQAGNARPVYGISSPTYQHKSYQLPHSLDDIAREYVSLIQREIQPAGPYLLGGWSMGGMIAIKMAAILESRDEEVLHVLLIDSTNPENIPAFADPMEHEFIASSTYNNVAKRMSLPTRVGGNGGSNSSSEDEGSTNDERVNLSELLPRMRKHIYNGLGMIGNVHRGLFLQETVRSPVTLVKCSSLARLPALLSDPRKGAIRKNFHDERSGWRMARFRSISFEAQHDSSFDRMHAGELTAILRGVLKEVGC
ncbi:hypothetical protein MMC24_002984 [Lignoscripta atroalba]|nr:hypothetical protein [Lignoscripta atroalba]